MTEYLIAAVFLVGLWGVLSKPNIVKKVIALNITNGAIVMFFVHHGAQSGTTAPIREAAGTAAAATNGGAAGSAVAAGSAGAAAGPGVAAMVDPLPQALMLTAIVVGICIIALGLALAVLLHRKFGTLDMRRIEVEAWGPHHE